MTDVTGGELLARALANEGVTFVFGLPCPEIDPLLAALDANGIRFVTIRHEAAAVHMAEGLYKTTGQVAVVLGNPGPGSANLVPGMLTARHEGVPVLAITSQHRAGVVYPATPATFQGQDQLDLFKPAVKWNGPVFEWTRIPELVRMAFREMWAGRPGPVQLEIPGPVLYATGDPATAPIHPRNSGRASQPQPADAQLALAADLLLHAKAPVIFAGTGVDRARANGALIEVAERLGCPVIPSMAGRSVMPHGHGLYFHSQSPAADELRRNADVMLVVGSRVGNLDVPFDKYWGDPAKCRVIQVDVDPRHIGVSRPVAVGIVADARATLEGLLAKLGDRAVASRGRRDVAEQQAAHRAWAQTAGGSHCGVDGPRHPPGAGDRNHRRGVRAGRGVLHGRRHDLALGGDGAALDATQLVPRHPGVRHAGHRDPIGDRREARRPGARRRLRHWRRRGRFQRDGTADRGTRGPEDHVRGDGRSRVDDGNPE